MIWRKERTSDVHSMRKIWELENNWEGYVQKRKSKGGAFIRGRFQAGKNKSNMGLEKVPRHNVLSWNHIVKKYFSSYFKMPM